MKNTKPFLMALDALCAWALATGAALVLLPAFGLQAPFWIACISTALLFALFALIEAKPRQALIALGSVVLLAGAVILVLGKWSETAAAVMEYTNWALQESRSTGTAPQLPLYIILCVPIALVAWLLMRLFPSLWAVTAVSVGLIAYKVIFLPEGWVLPFILLCGGIILFLPRVSLKGDGRLHAQALAAILAVPVLGIAVLLCPGADGEWRSIGLQHLVQDCQDLWEFQFGALPDLPLTSMRSMGLQPDSSRLGGDIEPGKGVVIFGDRQLLLRGQVMDTYTGSTWEDSGEGLGNFRLNSFWWRSRRKEAFGLDLPKPASKPLLDDMLTTVQVNLQTIRSTRSMFLPYRTQRIEAGDRDNELYFDMEGEVYWSRQSGGQYRYVVEAQIWNYRAKDFDKSMLLFEKVLRNEAADAALPGIEAQYLQLPDSLPDWVSDLAQSLTADAASPYAKAMALRDYLSGEEFTYTLTPGDPDPNADFVADFLTKKQGYCTYYASALTVLCRAAGIPARYAAGYMMIRDGARYAAKESTAHAWTEVYLANTGWVPLDALGMEIFIDETSYQETGSSGAYIGPAATPTPSPNPNAGADLEIPTEEETGASYAWVIVLVLILLVVAAVAVYRRICSRRFRAEYVLRKFPSPKNAADHCCAGLLRLLRLVHLQPKGGETLLLFWERAAERFSGEELGTVLSQTGQVLNRLHYGEIPPTKDELRTLCKAYAGLEAYAHKTLGVLSWLRL